MSQQNVEIVRRVYDEISGLDVSSEHFDPDFEMDMTEVPGIGIVGGFEAAREAFLGYATTFDDFRVEVTDVIHADDERVVTEIRDGGRVKGSEAEVWNRYFDVWTIRGGKIVHFSVHLDRDRALEVAGLAE